MLEIGYESKEELSKNILNGKIQKEILNYVKEIGSSNELSKNNIYCFFEAEVGDERIDAEKISSPGTNKLAKTLHDLIAAVYEDFISIKGLGEENVYKETIINSEMDAVELYDAISDVTRFEKVEKGNYLNFISYYGFDPIDSRIIYSACHNAWLNSDADVSMDNMICDVCASINDKKVRLEEIEKMDRHNLLDAIFYQDFEPYTTLHYSEEKQATLDEIMSHPDLSVIYNLSRKDATAFISQYDAEAEAGRRTMPKVMIVSDNLAIDNSQGECFIEDFDCHEKALKWVEGSSVSKECIEDIFETYNTERDSEDMELDM